MSGRQRGFTLIELLVALVLSVIIIEITWKVLVDQRSNMVGIRQRLRAQAVAREALKTLESEIRIAGFGQQFKFAAGTGGRIDSLEAGAGLTTCAGIQDANGSSVAATEGAPDANDTLTIAYPTVVSPTLGTDCSQISWSRYYVDGSANLMRVTASTLAGLPASTSISIVAKGVDVFQIRLGAMGAGASPLAMLPTAEACCATAAGWVVSGGTQTALPPSIRINPSMASTWSFLSGFKAFKAGERWRDSILLEPNAAFFNDVHALGASLTAGLYSTVGTPVATVDLLTMAVVDSGLSATASGLSYSFDLVIPADGNYKLGIKGISKTTSGVNLRIQTMNAVRVGRAPGALWWKDPSAMAIGDWSAVKQVEVILLSRAESMEDKRASTYTDLANFVQGTGPAGQFIADDKQIRTVFDHIFPVGNNGAN